MFSTCVGNINFTMTDIVTELTTMSATCSLRLYLAGQQYCEMGMHQDPSGACFSAKLFWHFWAHLSVHSFSLSISQQNADSVYSSAPLPPSLFPLTCTVWPMAAFFHCVWGLMTGLPGFDSHGSNSFTELAAYDGSSWIHQAPNFQKFLGVVDGCNHQIA